MAQRFKTWGEAARLRDASCCSVREAILLLVETVIIDLWKAKIAFINLRSGVCSVSSVRSEVRFLAAFFCPEDISEAHTVPVFFTLNVATTTQQMHRQLLAHGANSYTTVGSYHATTTPSV